MQLYIKKYIHDDIYDILLKHVSDYNIDSDIFEKFCNDNDYDWSRVKLIGILHYFNICTLYDNFKQGQYGDFLFLYGKYLLAKYQRDNNG